MDNIEYHYKKYGSSFSDDVWQAHIKIIESIDFIVEVSFDFNEPNDPRKTKANKLLEKLKKNVARYIKDSLKRQELQVEVQKRLESYEIEWTCDECDSKVKERRFELHWDHENHPSYKYNWSVLSEFNKKLDQITEDVVICTNPDCHKIWRASEYDQQVIQPFISSLKHHIEDEILRERGLGT